MGNTLPPARVHQADHAGVEAIFQHVDPTGLSTATVLGSGAFDAICSWVRVVVSLDSVGNGTQEVERSGRRSCCPSSLAWEFQMESCLAHLVMSACPQMIIVTGPELPKVSKSQKWRNAPSLDEL